MPCRRRAQTGGGTRPPSAIGACRYVDARIAGYRQQTIEAARETLAESTALQTELWSQAVAACARAAPQPCTILLLPALNAVFDVGTTRLWHPGPGANGRT